MAGWNDHVSGNYPAAGVFDYAPIQPSDLVRFVQIIITEGVPYACSKFPLAFEFARERAATRLGLNSKQISVTGSARIGYSLRPDAFGRPFEEGLSDIDLFIVDADLFESVAQDLKGFLEAWEKGIISPSDKEKEYWEGTKERDPKNIEQGFVDPHHIPLNKGFKTADSISHATVIFEKNLIEQVGRKIGSRVKTRVYKDWRSAIDRIKYNLKSALKYRGTLSSATSPTSATAQA